MRDKVIPTASKAKAFLRSLLAPTVSACEILREGGRTPASNNASKKLIYEKRAKQGNQEESWLFALVLGTPHCSN